MRKILFILSLLLSTSICQSQTTFCGLYVNQEGTIRKLDLKPDFTYTYYSQGPCGLVPANSDTGVFTMIVDTLFLKSYDTIRIQEKYLFISHVPTDKNTFWYWDLGTLAKIFKSDSILPANQSGRLSDHEVLFFGSYIKSQGYYDNGNISFKIETSDKSKTITNYYSTGQVKSIEQYYKDKKNGEWYYYKENGQIEKIETYNRNKLKTNRNEYP